MKKTIVSLISVLLLIVCLGTAALASDLLIGGPSNNASTNSSTESLAGSSPYDQAVVITTAAPVSLTSSDASTPSNTVTNASSVTITKHPYSENIEAGTSTSFVAKAANAASVKWGVTDERGNLVDESRWSSYRISVASSTTTNAHIIVSKAPIDLNGWSFYAIFTGYDGASVRTDAAILNVYYPQSATTQRPQLTPAPTPPSTAIPVPTPTASPVPSSVPYQPSSSNTSSYTPYTSYSSSYRYSSSPAPYNTQSPVITPSLTPALTPTPYQDPTSGSAPNRTPVPASTAHPIPVPSPTPTTTPVPVPTPASTAIPVPAPVTTAIPLPASASDPPTDDNIYSRLGLITLITGGGVVLTGIAATGIISAVKGRSKGKHSEPRKRR